MNMTEGLDLKRQAVKCDQCRKAVASIEVVGSQYGALQVHAAFTINDKSEAVCCRCKPPTARVPIFGKWPE